MPPPEDRVTALFGGAVGLALWAPALGIGRGLLTLQPLDLVVLAGWPLVLSRHRALDGRVALLAVALAMSFTLSFWGGGNLLVLVYYGLFTLPFLLLTYLIALSRDGALWLLGGFALGGGVSLALFLLQIALGAETLDFRSNLQFRLPPQWGRGFALMPEVSTFASHAVMLLGLGVALILHPATPGRLRRAALGGLVILLMVLMLSRSTGFLLVAPVLVGFAAFLTLRPSVNNLLLIVLLAALAALVLSLFIDAFYGARLESRSATRSAMMRLSSILAGLTPLSGGEPFGVGLGNNDLVRQRAWEVTRALGLGNGKLPDGINSLPVARIFEEGWPALLQMALSGALLLRACLRRGWPLVEVLLLVLAAGSFLSGLAITGYRGIYSSWLWMALPLAVLARQRDGLPETRGAIPCAAT